MPSTMSTSVSSDLFSSTVMTPSLPTFCIACAIILPIAVSPLDEMVPTWATSAEDATGLARFTRSLTTAATAKSMPRFKSIGFMPAATALAPSRTIACASTVAVVVPSPARSEVLEATSRTIWAPIFSNLSASSISLATVTPSLVMRGAPNDLSSTTLRPLGPSVTRTAWARVSRPWSILSRASTANLTSLAAISVVLSVRPHPREGLAGLMGCPSRGTAVSSGGPLLCFRFDQHAQDVALLHDEVLDAAAPDLGARPFAEQHPVAHLDVHRDELAGLVAATGPDRDDPALLRLFPRGVGNDDAAGGFFLGIDTRKRDTIVQRTEFHETSSYPDWANRRGRSSPRD